MRAAVLLNEHIWLLLSLLLLMPASAQLQTNRIEAWIEEMRPYSNFPEYELFQIASMRPEEVEETVDDATILQLNPTVLQQLTDARYPTLRLILPNESGDEFVLELAQIEIYSKDFQIVEAWGEGVETKRTDIPPGVFYRGIVENISGSLAAVSLFGNDLMVMFSTPDGDYEVSKLNDGTDLYVAYRIQNLKSEIDFSCATIDDVLIAEKSDVKIDSNTEFVGCKVVDIYIEVDYVFYVLRGSTGFGVHNFIGGVFNSVSTLYANEDIDVNLSEIFIWVTPDPYITINHTGNLLKAFRQNRGSNFNGHLAQFISGRHISTGGAAYRDVLCIKANSHGVSRITTTANSLPPFPTFSHGVFFLTHEIGHNLGSWHTHSCNWPGGAIDNCATPEDGNCPPGPPPINGGTIMSYCHHSNNVNFNKGFGNLPGNLIRNKVLAASCLPQTGSIPQNRIATDLHTTKVTVSWKSVPGAINYTVQRRVFGSNTWTTVGTSTNRWRTITGLSPGITYEWRVKTDCSEYSAPAQFTTLPSVSDQCAAPTGLYSSNITTNSALLNWEATQGSPTYTVEYKLQSAVIWALAGTTTTTSWHLTGLGANKTYLWRVRVECSDYSTADTLSTYAVNCPKPSSLASTVLTSSIAMLAWSQVPGAAYYIVQYRPSNTNVFITADTVTTTSFLLTGLEPHTNYDWRVRANCSSYSSFKTFTTYAFFTGESNENRVGDELSLYPNPTADILYVLYNTPQEERVSIFIADLHGRVLQYVDANSVLEGIQVGQLESGIYLLQLKTESGKSHIRKFVKF